MSNHIIIRNEVTNKTGTRCAVLSHSAFAQQKIENPKNFRRAMKNSDVVWYDIEHRRDFNEYLALKQWGRDRGYNPDVSVEDLRLQKERSDVKAAALAGPDGELLRELTKMWQDNLKTNNRIFDLEEQIMSRQLKVAK